MRNGESGGANNKQAPYQPTLKDMLMLEVPVAVQISPQGGRVAFNVRTTHWQDNRYQNVCYVHDLAAGTTHPINRSGSVQQMAWVGEESLALLKQDERENDRAQIWLYESLIGEGWPVTDHETGVEWFKPFAGGFLFKARHPERDKRKERADRFGKFTHFEQEQSSSALYYVGIQEMTQYQTRAKVSTKDEAANLVPPLLELSRLLEEPLSIREVIPSPAGDAIYLNCWPRDDLVYYLQTQTYCIELDAGQALAAEIRRQQAKKGAKKTGKQNSAAVSDEQQQAELAHLGTIRRLNLPQGASVAAVSPGGGKLLVAHQARDNLAYTRRDLWWIDREAAVAASFLAGMNNITAALDREIIEEQWANSGIYGVYPNGCVAQLAHLGQDGQARPVELGNLFPALTFHVSDTGSMALVAANATSFPEVYLALPDGDGTNWEVKALTGFGRAVAGWDLGQLETIRWQSRDGTEIEGVLRKPVDFDPTKKYPLLFLVHGGPRWFSADYLVTGEEIAYYPAVQLVHQDVLVLKPNYRGSLGRGQAFAELNADNLGIGDLWDLEGAIDHLEQLGWVDADRVGCMGWSQGGYISAFAGLHSDRFQAVSVGAGISDWYTYHISNDIPSFTVDYLSGSPFRGRELYARTSPISMLNQAKTPMLIQHGAEDRRVPLSNAMELYRGLQEMGVHVELFVYPGMGHTITRPRERQALMFQNLAWFSHYLLDQELKLE